ncbi:PhzF family phenazine biosynthesis protein [Wukongibacter baidiensis]|uniref:PhzF family phenazine biosynthesis protein n=1 Tax=Wukongibacter baidiensis TaxID=1723361 RepID=UPI003D7F6F6D
MEKVFYQVDAFTNEAFGGNPAAVVLNADNLSKNQMLKIAREMALSETAFVKKSDTKEYDYEVRFFTPTEEVDLCGHATIGTFSVMAKKGILKTNKNKIIVRQKTLAGILPVEIHFNSGNVSRVMMTQAKPKYVFKLEEVDEIASIMGINSDEIGLDGCDTTPMAFSTGLPDIILPVKNLEILKKINPDFSKLSKYSKDHEVVGVHAFTIKDYGDPVLISCRNFAPAYGINEEAATGTSNGALAAYLIKNDIIDICEKVDFICEQGYFMDRPSQIVVEVTKDDNDLIIKVGGEAVLVMEGKIYL